MSKKKALRSSRNKGYYASQYAITERNKFNKRNKHKKNCPNDLQALEAWK